MERHATLDTTAQALRSSAAAADGVSVLGAQPLAAFAGSLQDTAAQVTGVVADLDGIEGSLATAQPGVDALPGQLADLAGRLRTLGAGMHAAAAGVRDGLTRLMVWLVLAVTVAIALPPAAASTGAMDATPRDRGPSRMTPTGTDEAAASMPAVTHRFDGLTALEDSRWRLRPARSWA